MRKPTLIAALAYMDKISNEAARTEEGSFARGQYEGAYAMLDLILTENFSNGDCLLYDALETRHKTFCRTEA